MAHRRDDPTAGPLPELDAPPLRASLLRWYDRERRILPWRERPSLYGTWISEIMLQQTTVAAVEPRWLEFMDRFPDVAALAAADEADVLNAWSGLGYYRRARQLHAAARVVASNLGGDLPASETEWKDLPGIGPYTAGAIASIGLGEAVPAIDTNVVRVLTRLSCSTELQAKDFTPARVRRIATALVDPRRPGDWNQALMDLGAGPCSVTRPECSACPLASACRAKASGNQEAVPAAKPRIEPVRGVWSILVAHGPSGMLIGGSRARPSISPAGGGVIREDYTGLYRGYRSLPFSSWRDSADEDADAWRTWWMNLGGVWRVEPRVIGSFRHSVTRFRLRADVIAGEIASVGPDFPQAGFEIADEAASDRLALSPPSRRALALFQRK